MNVIRKAHIYKQKKNGWVYFFVRVKAEGQPLIERSTGIKLPVNDDKAINFRLDSLQESLRVLISDFELNKITFEELSNSLVNNFTVSKLYSENSRESWLTLVTRWLKEYHGDSDNPKLASGTMKETEVTVKRFNRFLIQRAIDRKVIKKSESNDHKKLIEVLHIPVHDINRELIQEYINYLAGIKNRKNEYISLRTIEVHRDKLRKFWKWGQSTFFKNTHGFDFPQYDPFIYVNYPKSVVQLENERQELKIKNGKTLTERELFLIVQEISKKGVCYVDCVIYSMFTGASLVDVVSLLPENINIESGRLVYKRIKMIRAHGKPKIINFPLTEQFAEWLKFVQKRYSAIGGKTFFCKEDGKPVQRDTLSHFFLKASRNAIQRDTTFGYVRHTLISKLITMRVPDADIAKLLGNSSRVIRATYDHTEVELSPTPVNLGDYRVPADILDISYNYSEPIKRVKTLKIEDLI